jgi:NAD(P)-dependent dehydrogenase (short-subunit alcohol dehydrogenase family)
MGLAVPGMRLKDKVALITGGASGISRATAALFALEGARVAVADYSKEGGQDTVKAIKEAGGDAMFTPVDVSDSAQVTHMVDAVVQAYGRIDILFNGAGILYYGTVLETDEQAWNRVLSINLTRHVPMLPDCTAPHDSAWWRLHH